MATRNKANEFLRAMNPEAIDETASPGVATPAAAPVVKAAREPAAKPTSIRKPGKPRQQLKHFGGYLTDETMEKIALLRIRLKKDNSELIEVAIDELHRKHMAKRAFGDA